MKTLVLIYTLVFCSYAKADNLASRKTASGEIFCGTVVYIKNMSPYLNVNLETDDPAFCFNLKASRSEVKNFCVKGKTVDSVTAFILNGLSNKYKVCVTHHGQENGFDRISTVTFGWHN